MPRHAIRGDPGPVAVHTSPVTRPLTGFPFLDAGRDEGAVLAFAHRGCARHPDIAGLENTLVAFEHAVRLGTPAATACCWPSTTTSWTG